MSLLFLIVPVLNNVAFALRTAKLFQQAIGEKMKTTEQFLKKENLADFLTTLPSAPLFGTVITDENVTYENITSEQLDRIVLDAAPPVESVKGFFFPAKECVAVYPNSSPSESFLNQDSTQTIIGARACDLAALKVLDKVFLEGEVSDPFYQKRRQNTFIITTECVAPAKYCFCNLLGGLPYAEQEFDVNLAPISSGFLISAGSEKGQDLLDRNKSILGTTSEKQQEERKRSREAAIEQLHNQNKYFEKPTNSPKKDKDQIFAEVLKDASMCVECGACSYICPTCHCFLLFDHRGEANSTSFIREKSWDSCILANFAKMAGVDGMKPTPRPELRDRFENRVRHKFEWMIENLNVVGCVGCGRCEAACMGGSDIRKVVRELEL